MSDALGYLLVSHEEQYGQHRVVLMREPDIQAEVERHSQAGFVVSPKQMDNFIGKILLKPKSTIVQHG
jgi:hypothetical protein